MLHDFMSFLFKNTIIVIIMYLSMITTIDASELKEIRNNIITIGIPVDEKILIANDPYFVYLQQAYKSLNISVEFIVLPGARSINMLKHGKIAGSYPRYTSLVTDSDVFINTPGFEIKQDIYAFSLQPIESIDALKSKLAYDPQKIGSVRGTNVVNTYIGDANISLFNRINHLVRALQKERVILILETKAVMARYNHKFTSLYVSQDAIIKGSLTQLLHYKHQQLADQLSIYFSENPINESFDQNLFPYH
jgi:hypothetical protein